MVVEFNEAGNQWSLPLLRDDSSNLGVFVSDLLKNLPCNQSVPTVSENYSIWIGRSALSHLLCLFEEIMGTTRSLYHIPPFLYKDATTYKKHVEEIQVFEFLVGFCFEYEQVRLQILNMNLSFLNEVYALICKEEGRHDVMNVQFIVGKLAFISTSSRGGHWDSFTHGRGGCFSTYDDHDCLSIVVSPGILRTNVGIYMGVYRIFFYIRTSEVDQI